MASKTDNDGSHNEVKRTTIRTFVSHESAELAAANLEARGIESWVDANDCGGWYTNLTAPGGVRLQVRVTDAEAAIALLNAEASPAEINRIETEAAASAPPGNSPMKKLAMGQSGLAFFPALSSGYFCVCCINGLRISEPKPITITSMVK
jgi:hypothetical protein